MFEGLIQKHIVLSQKSLTIEHIQESYEENGYCCICNNGQITDVITKNQDLLDELDMILK